MRPSADAQTNVKSQASIPGRQQSDGGIGQFSNKKKECQQRDQSPHCGERARGQQTEPEHPEPSRQRHHIQRRHLVGALLNPAHVRLQEVAAGFQRGRAHVPVECQIVRRAGKPSLIRPWRLHAGREERGEQEDDDDGKQDRHGAARAGSVH